MISARLLRLAVAIALLVWLLWSSVWTIRQDETGVVVRFGGVARTTPSGIHLTWPWPIERMEKVQTATSRTMPVGFTFIEQLRGGGQNPITREWLTGDTNIVKMEVTLYYNVSDPVQYLYNVSAMSDGFSNDMAIRKVAETVMTELLATMSIDQVLSTGKAQLRDQVIARSQAQLDDYGMGIRLTAFNLREVSPPPEVQDAFNEVTSAKSYREQQLSEAEGARRTAIPFARSEANRIISEAKIYQADVIAAAQGEASSFEKLALSLQNQRDLGMQRLWLESVERILQGRNAMILPPVPAGQTEPVYLRQ
jgi:modulator of FtsH protease HflK